MHNFRTAAQLLLILAAAALPRIATSESLFISEGHVFTNDQIRTVVTGTNLAGSAQLSVASTNGFNVGDWILIITMQDGETNLTKNTAGQYQFTKVTEIVGNSLIVSPLQFDFVARPGGSIQALRVPVYDSVTLEGTLTCSAWDGTNGGVLAMLSRGKFTIGSNGVVHANGKGFRGGIEHPESPSIGGAYGHAGEGALRNPPLRATSELPEPLGGGGSPFYIYSGGGGGYGTAGADGTGRGAAAFGNKQLDRLYCGGGGGSGGVWGTQVGGAGGNGGGIVIIRALNLLGSGRISCRGDAGVNGHTYGFDATSGGGGGAGGSILLSSVTFDTNLAVLGTGGPGGAKGRENLQNGGSGGDGRIRIDTMDSTLPTTLPSVGFSTLTSSCLFAGLELFDGSTDTDSDLMPDYWETAFGLDTTNASDATLDNDTDGLNNIDEFRMGLNPHSPDTDGDGLTETEEMYIHATNALLVDTDSDGMPDAWETSHCLNPRLNDAADDLDNDGVLNIEEYRWNTTHTNHLDPGKLFSQVGVSDYEVYTGGHHTNRMYYDRNDRLLGLESSRGVSFAYVYDGNDNIVSQATLSRHSESNGIPVLWRFVNGLTNDPNPYLDSDVDGWTDYQEWRWGSIPLNASNSPGSHVNPGAVLAAIRPAFYSSNFVLGVGQLFAGTPEEVVIGTDCVPGTNLNYLLLLSQSDSAWTTQCVDVGAVGITSLTIGHLTNRPGPAIYIGTREVTNGSLYEFRRNGASWESNRIAVSQGPAAFVLGCRGADLLVSLTPTNGNEGTLCSVAFVSNNWSQTVLNTNRSTRGLGGVLELSSDLRTSMRLLDEGGVQVASFEAEFPTQGLVAHYRFDGSATDSSGQAHNGTLNGGSFTADRFGNPNAALSLAGGTTNYLISNPFNGFPSNAITVAFWMRSSDTNNFGAPISYAVQGVGNDNEFGFEYKDFGLSVSGNGIKNLGISVTDGTWTHVALTWQSSNGEYKIYRNGMVAKTGNVSEGSQLRSGGSLVIGQEQDTVGGTFDPDQAFIGQLDDFLIYARKLTDEEISLLGRAEIAPIMLPEPTAISRFAWQGPSLAAGGFRNTELTSLFYAFVDDKNGSRSIDFEDEWVLSEFALQPTGMVASATLRTPLDLAAEAESYALASLNYLNSTNDLLFTGEPDGQVYVWTAVGTSNALQRRIFSSYHRGKAWHAMAGIKMVEGEGLVGLLVDPDVPNECKVVLWPPQTELPKISELPNTAPCAVVLPGSNSLGAAASLVVRLWDQEGNESSPAIQYKTGGFTNWLPATIKASNGSPVTSAVRFPAPPLGADHQLIWNAAVDFSSYEVETNVLLRARAEDFMLSGDWSVPTPFQLNMRQDSNANGIPDGWEIKHFGDLTHSGTGDYDGDGAGNRAEYVADTNPKNASSYLQISSVVAESDGIHLSWSGGSLARQYIQKANLLDGLPVWVRIFTNEPPTSVTSTFTDDWTTNGASFYRVEVERP